MHMAERSVNKTAEKQPDRHGFSLKAKFNFFEVQSYEVQRAIKYMVCSRM